MDIENIFGTNVRLIVEGETKVTKLREYNSTGDIQGMSKNNSNKTTTPTPSSATNTNTGTGSTAGRSSGGGEVEAEDQLVFSKNEKNAIDMQQLFIAMTKEVRIIIVKLADRLHNMRTLKHMPSHKQKKIAQETLTIFAPLANLLGLHKIQTELEDLSFKYSQPDEYRALKNRVRVLKMDQSPVVYEARKALKSVLKEDPFFQQIACEVDIRMCNRSLYNIHKKLKSNDLQLRDLQNIAQLHVIATPRTDLATLSNISGGKVSAVDRQVCYYLLGKVHEIWAPIPGKFKDFIATPKGNNYQSLHTTVIPLGSKDLFPLEIQVRTHVMNMLAETGYAAHRGLVGDIMTNNPTANSVSVSVQSSGKPITNGNSNMGNGNGASRKGGGVGVSLSNGNSSSSSSKNGVSTSSSRDLYTEEVLWQTGWLNAVKDWQKEFVGSVTAQEFVETVVGDFLPRTIFVFTPDGTLVSLPKGATIVDFAYQIHSNVGNQMLMAKVNGVPTHPSHELKLAEVIEVVRHNGPATHYILKRQKEYLTYAKSRSTRHKILKFLKTHADILAQAPTSKRKEQLKSAMKNRVYNDDNDNLADIISPYRRGEVLWLILKCHDQVGLLANVSTIISSSGLSIRAYSGSANEYSKVFLMNFELNGRAKASKLRQMCETLNDLDCILSFAIGCNWSPPNILH
jgi:(p)ppGpp synthase/HD superfamily hydrolase